MKAPRFQNFTRLLRVSYISIYLSIYILNIVSVSVAVMVLVLYLCAAHFENDGIINKVAV